MLASLNSLALEETFGEQLYAINAKPSKCTSLIQRIYAALGWLDGLQNLYKKQNYCTPIKECDIAIYPPSDHDNSAAVLAGRIAKPNH